ncbi:hypothetical protein NEOLEDRAFT_1184581 [Neolentinus lepideus HHB14362 ss-1]|uniref:Uncharacterized protein n=1 Tax=Neolentinus lepideus HHB14362 ss-1 TaxID=1314782 RepID=A0A165MAF4_9AGAM|nr:hypothetical protein NEOLEDRAFT_1184581 [Neolentinus lepideus HHB14362 ss-1]
MCRPAFLLQSELRRCLRAPFHMAYSPPSPQISASSIGATFLMRAVRIDTWHDHGYHDTAAPQNGPALYPSIGSIARPRIIEEARSNAKSRRTRLAPVRGAARVLEFVAQDIGRRAHVD